MSARLIFVIIIIILRQMTFCVVFMQKYEDFHKSFGKPELFLTFVVYYLNSTVKQ